MQSVMEWLDRLAAERESEIEAWFAARRREVPPFLYNSVDLRHAGFKLAPVDTNLFPAGFNNLSEAASRRAIRHADDHLNTHSPGAKKIIILPESHTRNLAYVDNLIRLKTILEGTGREVRMGSLIAPKGEGMVLDSLSGQKLELRFVEQKNSRLATDDGFIADAVVLNNDCTAGIPPVIEGLSIPVMPPAGMGWFARRKTKHFDEYHSLTSRFALDFDFDPWLLSAHFHRCGMIDFRQQSGLECVALGVERVLNATREKYRQYGIEEEPYAFVKADSGTYGMGIMTVKSGEEMMALNKKERNKMNVIKEGATVHEVIIQEGVPTIDSINGSTAEPMVYLVDGVPVGGMYRINAGRDRFGNLNASGMEFARMCEEGLAQPDCTEVTDECRFRPYGLVAALAALATAREEAETVPQLKAAANS